MLATEFNMTNVYADVIAEAKEAAAKKGATIKSGPNKGTFSGGFEGCIASGKSAALCAYIGRKAGKIK